MYTFNVYTAIQMCTMYSYTLAQLYTQMYMHSTYTYTNIYINAHICIQCSHICISKHTHTKAHMYNVHIHTFKYIIHCLYMPKE